MSVFFGKDEPPIWLSLIGLITIVILVVGEFDYVSLLAGIIAILSARQCFKWSRKINGKGYWAYFTGLLFSLFGLLAYYLYYKYKSKNTVVEKVDESTAEAEIPEQKAKK